MAISRELILGPADIDRVSVRCASCTAGVEVTLGLASHKCPDLPEKCASCGAKWTEMHHAIQAFGRILTELEKYHARFRITEPESGKG